MPGIGEGGRKYAQQKNAGEPSGFLEGDDLGACEGKAVIVLGEHRERGGEIFFEGDGWCRFRPFSGEEKVRSGRSRGWEREAPRESGTELGASDQSSAPGG